MINRNNLLKELDYYISHSKEGSDSEYAYKKCKELVERQDVTFTIKVSMPGRWVDDFISFLKYMEWCGNVGHSGLVGFYADGDGDFRPKFQITGEYTQKPGIPGTKITKKPEIMFDAG